jgi:serine/threonine protein kinase
MAPERFSSGEIETSSDIYALACVLFQALTGQLPFPGTTLEQVAMAHMTTPPPKPSAHRRGIPVAIDDVIATGLAKNPNQRYRTAKDLAQSARGALTTQARETTAQFSVLPTQPAVAPLPRTVAAKPSSQHVQPFLPLAGRWAKVVTTGDDHYGQIGRISAICDDDDEDGLDIIVEFRGDPSSYAFRRDELVAASAPANAVGSGDQFPKAPQGVRRPDVSVPGLILFLVLLVAVATLFVVAMAMLRP